MNPSPHPILKEIHHCEVAGQTLEAANVYALKAKVERLLETIAPARALPLCYFRAPAMDYELPVYEQGGWLTVARARRPADPLRATSPASGVRSAATSSRPAT